VTRPELFQRTPYNRPIRWHDLRATTSTWLAVQGKDMTEIRDVLGHCDVDMTNKYTRRSLAIRNGAFRRALRPSTGLSFGPRGFRSSYAIPSARNSQQAKKTSRSSGAEGNRSCPHDGAEVAEIKADPPPLPSSAADEPSPIPYGSLVSSRRLAGTNDEAELVAAIAKAYLEDWP
jgi:hypothetical protein